MKACIEVICSLFENRLPIVLFVVFAALFFLQNTQAQGELTVSGVVKASNRPVAKHVVMYMPIDESEQQPVTVYASGSNTLSKQGSRQSAKNDWNYTYYVQKGRGGLKNARTLSNEQGAFSLVITGLKPIAGKQKVKIAIGVFSGSIDEPLTSDYEIAYVEVDVGSPTFDARNIELKAIKEKAPKP